MFLSREGLDFSEFNGSLAMSHISMSYYLWLICIDLVSNRRLKKVLTTPVKRKKFENGWSQHPYFKYCNRWTFITLLAG